jgi:hypothetical protein
MRKGLGVALLCGSVVVTTFLVAMGSPSSDSSIGESSTTTLSAGLGAPNGAPISVGSAAASAIAEQVAPYGYQLDGVEPPVVAAANLVNVTATRTGGGTVSVGVYRRFDSQELRSAGLTSRSTASGTVWVGARDSELTSIYYLSSSGVGLHIASVDRSAVRPLTIEQLGTIAQNLASSPEVISAATPQGITLTP